MDSGLSEREIDGLKEKLRMVEAANRELIEEIQVLKSGKHPYLKGLLKVEREQWEERELELRETVKVNCPSCGFDGEGSVRSEGVVKAVKEAEARVWEDAAKTVESFYDKTFWDDPSAGIAATIRAKAGEKGE